MIRYITIFFALGWLGSCFAQQLPQWSQYNFNYYIQNPALGGLDVPVVAQVGYRTQWVGFDAAPPKTSYVSIHAPLNYTIDNNVYHKAKPHHGVGGYVFQDQSGLSKFTGVNFSYSYHMNISKDKKLSFGSFFGFKQYSLKGSSIVFTHTQEDPNISYQDVTQTVPDASVGIWYHTSSLFVGVSAQQVLRSNLSFSSDANTSDFGALRSHLVANVGAIISLDRYVKIVPSVLVKSVSSAPIQVDFSNKTIFDEKMWFIVSLRNLDAVVGAVGLIYENFEIGYAYDFTLNEIQNSSYGTHEIILKAYFPKEKELTCPSRFW